MYVVSELFTSTSCGYCPAARSVLRTMADDKDSHPYIIPLIWQLNEYMSPNAFARYNLYKMPGVPAVQWNGESRSLGSNSTSYRSYYNYYANSEAYVNLNLDLSITGNTLNASLKISEQIPITPDKTKVLFLVTYNRDIEQPGDYFASVVKFEEQIYVAGTTDYSQSFTLDSSWDHNKTNVVVMVQDFGETLYVHNATQKSLTQLSAYDKTIAVADVKLGENYPNPFNPSTTIKFTVGEQKTGFLHHKTTNEHNGKNVIINIYNIKGQKIRTLVNSVFPTGEHKVEWNGKDDNGMSLGSGVYLYELETDSGNETMKMLMLK